MSKVTAYCFQEGDVYIGKDYPEGALPIIKGPSNDVHEFVNNHCIEVGFDSGKAPVIVPLKLAFENHGEGSEKLIDVLEEWLDDRVDENTNLNLEFI